MSNVKEEEFKAKVETLSNEFADKLKNAVCIGYSLFDTNIDKRSSGGLRMTSYIGLKMLVDGEEIHMSANIKFDRGTVREKPSERAWLKIDYDFAKGRDCYVRYHDEVSNHPGNSKSINGIRTSDMLFKVLYNLTAPIFDPSPMPMFG